MYKFQSSPVPYPSMTNQQSKCMFLLLAFQLHLRLNRCASDQRLNPSYDLLRVSCRSDDRMRLDDSTEPACLCLALRSRKPRRADSHSSLADNLPYTRISSFFSIAISHYERKVPRRDPALRISGCSGAMVEYVTTSICGPVIQELLCQMLGVYFLTNLATADLQQFSPFDVFI